MGDKTEEYKAVIACTQFLRDVLKTDSEIVTLLRTKNVIDDGKSDEVNALDERKKGEELFKIVRDAVKHDKEFYHQTLMPYFSGKPIHRALNKECPSPAGTKPQDGGTEGKKDHLIKRLISGVLHKMKAHIKVGIPALNIPTLDPLKLDDFHFSVRENLVNCEASFHNVVITGLSTITFPTIDFDEGSLKLTVTAHVTELKATGEYNLDGTALFFMPLSGDDDVYADAEMVTVNIDVVLSSPDITKADFKVSGVKLEVEDIRVNFRNLEGEDDLGGALNEILNLFGKQIFDLVEPGISREVETALQKLIDEEIKSKLHKKH